MNALHMTFTLWKAAFREDCQHEHKLQAFDAMGDSAMMLFYERGVEPTVQGILNDASPGGSETLTTKPNAESNLWVKPHGRVQ